METFVTSDGTKLYDKEMADEHEALIQFCHEYRKLDGVEAEPMNSDGFVPAATVGDWIIDNRDIVRNLLSTFP